VPIKFRFSHKNVFLKIQRQPRTSSLTTISTAKKTKTQQKKKYIDSEIKIKVPIATGYSSKF